MALDLTTINMNLGKNKAIKNLNLNKIQFYNVIYLILLLFLITNLNYYYTMLTLIILIRNIYMNLYYQCGSKKVSKFNIFKNGIKVKKNLILKILFLIYILLNLSMTFIGNIL